MQIRTEKEPNYWVMLKSRHHQGFHGVLPVDVDPFGEGINELAKADIPVSVPVHLVPSLLYPAAVNSMTSTRM